MTFTKQNKFIFIAKHTFFFILLLPLIQATQLYVLFNIIDLILLIMPVTVGSIVGTLVGVYRYKNLEHISKLKYIQYSLEEQVMLQTQELEEKNLVLEKMAKTDSLTKLGNRVLMKEVLEAEYAKVSKEYQYISVMMIDIDYFKRYNDFYGHIKGDEVLAHLGNYFLENSKKYNYTPIRFGGEEFCIILPDCDKECAGKNAQIIIQDIQKAKILHDKSEVSKYITMSIGIHTTNNIQSYESCTLINDADKALYSVKENGRNNYEAL